MGRYEQGRLNQREILRLFKTGVYRADIEEGVVYGRNGRPLKPYLNEAAKYQIVPLYLEPKRKSVAVHRLIWMVGTGRTIPEGFEVHHRDGDTFHNCFENLMCVHSKDHQKLHRSTTEDDIPF